MNHTIELPKDQETDIVLVFPNKQQIVLQYRLESPSVDICLPQNLRITNWCDDNLTPAAPTQLFFLKNDRHRNQYHILDIRQACIDIPPNWVDTLPIFTEDELLAAHNDDGHGIEGCDLASNAAQAAAAILAENWSDATNCGEKLVPLLADVDEVIAALKNWKQGLEKLAK